MKSSSYNNSDALLNAINEIHKETLEKNTTIFFPLTEKEVSQLVDLFDVNEKYMGFEKLEGELKKKGLKNPAGAAAAIGFKKYGKKSMEQHAHAGIKEDIIDEGWVRENPKSQQRTKRDRAGIEVMTPKGPAIVNAEYKVPTFSQMVPFVHEISVKHKHDNSYGTYRSFEIKFPKKEKIEEDLIPTTTPPKINATATVKPPKIAKPKVTPSPMKVNVGMAKPPKTSTTVSETVEAVHEKFGIGKILPGDYNDTYDVMFEHGIEKIHEDDLIILEKKDRKEFRDKFAKEKVSGLSVFKRVRISPSEKKDKNSDLGEDVGTADRKVVLAKTPSGKPVWRKIKTKQNIVKQDDEEDKSLDETKHLVMQIQDFLFELEAPIVFKSGEKIIIEASEANEFLEKYKALDAVERAEMQSFACESYDNFKEVISEDEYNSDYYRKHFLSNRQRDTATEVATRAGLKMSDIEPHIYARFQDTSAPFNVYHAACHAVSVHLNKFQKL